MRLIYWIASYLLFGALFPLLLLHPKLRQGARLRLGLYPASPFPARRGPRLWIHGASAGDLSAVLPIIHELRARRSDLTIVVSTMTNSGYAVATSEKFRRHVDEVSFVPYDFLGSTRRAVRAIQPDVLVLEYAEIWPNLIHAAVERGAKVALTNGRFSEALIGRYRWLYRIIGNPLREMSLLLMREEREAERALALGASPEAVRVTGNTKFDNVAKDPDEAVVRALELAFGFEGEPVFVAGSTHEGEERGVIEAFLAMRKIEPRLRMIVAPRYTERGAKVLAIARGLGLDAALRSEARGGRPAVLVLDTIGELLAAYRLARLVFVGGSFVKRGGQNILEPAGQGRAVLFGPFMANFRDSVEVLLGRGAIQVANPEQLATVAADLIARPEELDRLGQMAKSSVQRVRGASSRNAEAILGLLDGGISEREASVLHDGRGAAGRGR